MNPLRPASENCIKALAREGVPLWAPESWAENWIELWVPFDTYNRIPRDAVMPGGALGRIDLLAMAVVMIG